MVKSSKRSNNGTDVGSGQIPEILYKIPEVEKETGLQIQLLDKSFSTTVSAVRTPEWNRDDRVVFISIPVPPGWPECSAEIAGVVLDNADTGPTL